MSPRRAVVLDVTPEARARRNTSFRQGARSVAPLLVAIVPFGIAVGATATSNGVPGLAGWSSSWLIYGGAGQLVAMQLLGAGAGMVAVVLAVIAVNARLVLYSAGMATYWSGTSSRWRAFAGYLIVDPLYLVVAPHHEITPEPESQRAFYLGAGLTMWASWLFATSIGVVAGDRLPAVLAADLLLPLVLIGMAAAASRTRCARTAALSAAAAAVALHWLPLQLGFLAAGCVGVAAGMWSERRFR
jgi:predicted branched-subunit amino acid permease